MKILYVHGFGVKFDRESPKLKVLKEIAGIYGFDVDYSKPPNDIVNELADYVIENKIDLVVGTSLGGYFTNLVGSKCGIPFVMINPTITPAKPLAEYIGKYKTSFGVSIDLKKEVVELYTTPIDKSGYGLVLLDSGDTVINSTITYNALVDDFNIKIYAGGCHRFDHMLNALPLIVDFYENAGISHGLEI